MNSSSVIFGIDSLLSNDEQLRVLKNKQVGLVGHPSSTNRDLQHSLDALIEIGIPVRAAFGPQHGMRGDKQDNMIESDDYVDERHHIPVHSLYGQHRRPTEDMLKDLDIILIDLQDLGCRIYTYLTTLAYFIDACAKQGKSLWVLDRPNPAGRKVEGLTLVPGQESFVGCAPIPMRHGLTLGEFARWYKSHHALNLDLEIVEMENYQCEDAPGFGWPVNDHAWINPSPNASSLNMARCYPGTVLLEGTELSEGRGTTTPLELVGAPDLHVHQLLESMQKMAPDWLQGAAIRPCFFEPTFHKHQGKLCQGFQFHTDSSTFEPERFSPFRVIALFLKALRQQQPDYAIWRHHDYEYEMGRTPIDVINGSSLLKDWVDDPEANVSDLSALLNRDEENWTEQSKPFHIY